MKLIIVGCGRIGSELAQIVAAEGHQVTVIDESSQNFDRLGTRFSGHTVAGNLLDQAVLHRAGIEEADGLAAVTADDPTNFVIARAAKEIFNVPNVVVRAYDPLRSQAFEKLGIRVITSSSWGAQRMTQLLTHPGILPTTTLGHGQILIVEIQVKTSLQGVALEDIPTQLAAQPVALIRKGQGLLPDPKLKLELEDTLAVSVPANQLEKLSQLMKEMEA